MASVPMAHEFGSSLSRMADISVLQSSDPPQNTTQVISFGTLNNIGIITWLKLSFRAFR